MDTVLEGRKERERVCVEGLQAKILEVEVGSLVPLVAFLMDL